MLNFFTGLLLSYSTTSLMLYPPFFCLKMPSCGSNKSIILWSCSTNIKCIMNLINMFSVVSDAISYCLCFPIVLNSIIWSCYDLLRSLAVLVGTFISSPDSGLKLPAKIVARRARVFCFWRPALLEGWLMSSLESKYSSSSELLEEIKLDLLLSFPSASSTSCYLSSSSLSLEISSRGSRLYLSLLNESSDSLPSL